MELNYTAQVLIDLAITLLAAFCLSRIAKRLRLPNVTGYILAGILIGPHCLKLIDAQTVEAMSFLTDAALAFIAYGVGKLFKWISLNASGVRVVVVTVLEALAAAAAVTGTMLLFGLPLDFSLLLGAIASATAPASTLMTIKQYKAKGHFVDTVLQVVALDDAVALIAFSVCATVAGMTEGSGAVRAQDILLPLAYNVAAILVGGALAFVLKWLMQRVTSDYNRLLLVVIMLMGLAGACAAVDVSPLLACMVFGAMHANLSRKQTLFKKVDRFTPPVLTLFFVLSGMRLNVPMLASVGAIGVAYFVARIAGKCLGARVGAVLAHETPEVRNCLGLALIPQAGVSIGLAALAERMLSPELGSLLSVIILSSAVLYELVGPASARLALRLAGVIPEEKAVNNPAAECTR